MTLILCPECGHEVSTTAAACPNCARPLHAPPVVERKVIVAQPVDPEGGFPTWALIPIGLLGVVLIFVAYIAFRGGEDTANTNVNVNIAGKRSTTDTRSTSTTTVPSTSVPATDTTVSRPPTQTTTVPGTSTAPPVAPAPDKGTVVLNAKATSASGSTQAVRGTKFYLLEEDVESILREARVEPIEGNTLAGSLGLAAVFPERYGDFQRAAMRAIASKAKYSGTTGGTGGASLAGVEPKGYYLFGIAKIGRGFALWNSPVSVIAGDNMLNLSPQAVTEIEDPNG
ncbi:MAG: zinc ribbon domain-containing protein [Pyrinomonadaceae bacterium]